MIQLEITYRDQDDMTQVVYPLHSNFDPTQLPELDRRLVAAALEYALERVTTPVIEVTHDTLTR